MMSSMRFGPARCREKAKKALCGAVNANGKAARRAGVGEMNKSLLHLKAARAKYQSQLEIIPDCTECNRERRRLIMEFLRDIDNIIYICGGEV